MKEEKLKLYFENRLTVEELAADLRGSQEKIGLTLTRFHIEDNDDGEFEITKNHLVKIADDFLNEKLSDEDIKTIAFSLISSDYFGWDSETTDGEIVANVLFDWDNPEINYPLTTQNFRLWKHYLLTGDNKIRQRTR